MRPVHREVVKFVDSEGGNITMQPPTVTRGNGAAMFGPTRRVGARGGPQLFAQKLFTLVEEEDSDIVEWLPDGLAFRVKDIQRFSCEVLEKYFNHSKFTSFQRQLNLYQFKRRKGAHAGAFHHPCFRRGQRHLLSKVRRQKVKRDLAVEARAAQKLARVQAASSHSHRSSEHSDRGRTRAASQTDIRRVKSERNGGLSDEDNQAGSRRSALRRRVVAGPSRKAGGGRHSESQRAPCEISWSSDNIAMDGLSGSGSTAGSAGVNREWGGKLRQSGSGSPERSSRTLVDPFTPVSAVSADYSTTTSPGSTTSDGSSSSSSSCTCSPLSITTSHSSSSPHHPEILQRSSPGKFDNDIISDSSLDSPLSMHSPVAAAVAMVQAVQVSPGEHDLSLSMVVDSPPSWQSTQQQQQQQPQRPFDPFAWSGVDGGAPLWSEPVPPASSQQTQQEDFGFIDLFAENLQSSEDSTPDSSYMEDGRMEAFMKEAEAAGVFGMEEYLLPRAGPGGGGTGARGCGSVGFA